MRRTGISMLIMLISISCLSASDETQGSGRMPVIENLEQVRVIGINTLVSSNYNVIGHQWERFMARQDEIIDPVYNQVGVGITYDVQKMSEEQTAEYYFFHLVGTPVENFDNIPEGMSWFLIPAGQYARFTHKGDLSELADTYAYIYEDWFPVSKYEYDNEKVEFEWYDENFKPETQNSEFYIYVPVLPASQEND